MNTIQRLRNQSLLAKILFWSGQIIGAVTIIPLLLFFGGNIIDELINGLITIKEEPTLVILLASLLGVAIGLIIAWFRAKTGALITIISSIAASLMWGFNELYIFFMLLLPMVSGILLLISAYQKEGKPGA